MSVRLIAEIDEPPEHHVQNLAGSKPGGPGRTGAMIEAQEYRRNRPRDLEALHAMQAARPLKPPRYDFGPRRVRAGLLAVREDRKAGVLV